MENYFSHLISSSLPIPLWALIIIWLVLFFVAHVLSRQGNNLADKQNFIITNKTGELVQKQNWKLAFFQIVFTSAIFAFATLEGGAFFVFFAGGWVILTAISIPLNLRSVLYLRALSQPDAATGSVIISNRLAVKDAAFKLFTMAIFCLLVGLVLAQLALLGAAFFMLATAIGYLRKSKKKTNDLSA